VAEEKASEKETITMARVPDFLGPQKYLPEVAERPLKRALPPAWLGRRGGDICSSKRPA